jgi:hypothetical protein
MDLDPAFIAQCAPGVAAETIRAIVRVESGGDALALGINSPAGRVMPDDARQAARLAQRYIERGYSVDLGHWGSPSPRPSTRARTCGRAPSS